jgi:hypothetical protein
MSSKLTPTALPTPPKEYDIGYMDRLVKQIALEFTKSRAVTPFTCGSDLSNEAGFPISGLTIVNPPISSTGSPPDGFPEGSVWCDTTSENSLKIITSGPYTDQDSLNLANTTDPALGDALIGFRQSNASGILTGAVGRTVHEKLQEIISVKDFGAVGDGSANDTTAIQTAVDSVSYSNSSPYGGVTGKILYFPAGTYKITAAINVPVNGGLSFFGEGKTKSTVWQSTADANIFNMTGNNFRGEFYGMHLAGNLGQVSGPSKAINIGPNGNQIFVQNCWFNTVGYAIYGYPTSDSNFINNTFEYIHTPIYLAGSGNGYFTIADNVFYNCAPVSQGASEQRASFEFQNTTNTIFTSNRFVSDSPISPQSGGYILINNCVEFIMSDNVMGVNSLTAANIIITNSSKVRVDNNTLPEAFRQQMSISGCTDIVVSNNRLSTTKILGLNSDNLIDVVNTKKLRFIGNYVGAATNYVVYVRTTCEDIVIANNNFDGGAYTASYRTILMETTNKAVVTGNTFRNGLNGEDFACGTTSNLVFSGNTLDLGFNIDAGVAPSSVFGNVGGTTRTYLNVAPTVGTWKQGDAVWFQQPSSGGYIGAVCTTAGTPGTWMPFGQAGVATSIAATPSYVGQIAVVAGVGYLATGVASPTDWTQIT